jgi:hypothetical protein
MTLNLSSVSSKGTLTIKLGAHEERSWERAVQGVETESLRSTHRKAAVLGEGGRISCAMQNPNDH